MKDLSRASARINETLPLRILQFGGGNFLRGFVDWIIHKYNVQSNDDKLGILAVKVRKEGNYQKWKEQDGLFHLFTKGFSKGKTVDKVTLVKSVVEILEVHQEYQVFIASARKPGLNIIISNTTEAGITFDKNDQIDQIPSTFPGQLSQWLIERFRHFKGDSRAACTVIPCELLDQNGQVLKDVLLEYAKHWQIEDSYSAWLQNSCRFCNTLVDRIVPGIDSSKTEEYWDRIGYRDQMMTEGEPYHLWAIESIHDLGAKLPLDRIGLNVIYTKDLTPYKELKLKILNGAHTSMVPVGLLMGINNVKEAITHENLGKFLRELVFNEIVPILDVDQDEAIKFANDVIDRFQNPFLDHKLAAISLYSISKFNARVKPSLKAFCSKEGKLPEKLVLAFTALITFYRGNYNGRDLSLKDRQEVIDRMKSHWDEIESNGEISETKVKNLLADEALWEEDLSDIEGLCSLLTSKLRSIVKEGIVKALK